MAVSIAEYLGQRTDVDQQIVPVAKGTQIQCEPPRVSWRVFYL